MKKHCCKMMTDQFKRVCKQHSDRFDCPDALIVYADKIGKYGIIIHDGGTSFIVIDFCPWCGSALK